MKQLLDFRTYIYVEDKLEDVKRKLLTAERFVILAYFLLVTCHLLLHHWPLCHLSCNDTLGHGSLERIGLPKVHETACAQFIVTSDSPVSFWLLMSSGQ
jgi:hypothetical protein